MKILPKSPYSDFESISSKLFIMDVKRLISCTMLMSLVAAASGVAAQANEPLLAQFEAPPGTKPVSGIEQVKQQNEQCLLGINGVTGLGSGKDASGKDVIIVYLINANDQKYIPKKLNGFAVQTRVTGTIKPRAQFEVTPRVKISANKNSFGKQLAQPKKIDQVKQQYEQCLLGISGVNGVGISKDANGKDVIVIYLLNANVQKYIPKKLDGFGVQTKVTGVIKPL
ncbi:hypothetical protein [Fortiea contorta]|uniref:hypothetical protein n=1 Tax=Fortiea contorta TaxID=1892405 RepID=UPI000378FE62|nr:hypothetical protein [Fortiea contorta]